MSVRDAIAWINSPPAFLQIDGGEAGLCLKNVRYAFGIAPKYGSAAEAGRAQKLYPGVKPGSAPRNRPYFWSGGSHGDGHVGITDGYTAGGHLRVWTTDWPSATGKHDGKWRRVRVDHITARWGLTPMGYGNTLNGVAINL